MNKVQKFTRLENLADIIMGQSPDSSSCTTEEHGLPFLQGCAEFGKQSPTTEIYCFLPLRISKPESILISVRAPVGKLNWSDQSYCIGRGLGTVKAKSGISDTRFLGYAIEQNVSFLHRRSQGSTFLAVGSNDLKTFPIPVFSYDQQKKIARILNNIDRTIAKTEALIEKYQQIKAGLMHDLFARGIGSDGKLRPPREVAPELYKNSAIGWIPKEWKTEPLGNLCEIASGGTPSRVKDNFWGGSIPWIKTGEIKYNKIFETEEYITEEGLRLSSAKLFNEGTVVMAIYGEGNTRGRVAILGRKCSSNQACVGFSFSNLVQSQFMYFLFENNYKVLRDFSNDGSQKNLSASLLKQFDISFPTDVEEQSRISNQLLVLDGVIKREQKKQDKLQKQKSGLMHDLLTGKVSVNVDSDAD